MGGFCELGLGAGRNGIIVKIGMREIRQEAEIGETGKQFNRESLGREIRL